MITVYLLFAFIGAIGWALGRRLRLGRPFLVGFLVFFVPSAVLTGWLIYVGDQCSDCGTVDLTK